MNDAHDWKTWYRSFYYEDAPVPVAPPLDPRFHGTARH